MTLIEGALSDEDADLQNKCVKALDQLKTTCDQFVSEQHYSCQGGIVLQDENARVHLGHLCLNYNLALIDPLPNAVLRRGCGDILGRFLWESY